jgi:hypothetical protein
VGAWPLGARPARLVFRRRPLALSAACRPHVPACGRRAARGRHTLGTSIPSAVARST